jgi:diguanylate cyclase (GGDEF)-like protein
MSESANGAVASDPVAAGRPFSALPADVPRSLPPPAPLTAPVTRSSDPAADITRAELVRRATEARHRGDAAEAFAQLTVAADRSADATERRRYRARALGCLGEMHRDAEVLAMCGALNDDARAAGDDVTLVESLATEIIARVRRGERRIACTRFAELRFVTERLADHHPDVQRALAAAGEAAVAVGAYDHALGLLDRALRAADSELTRASTYVDLTVAYHYAAVWAESPRRRGQLVHDGLYAATAALEAETEQLGEATDERAVALVKAHRAHLLCHIGHYHAALDDAHDALAIADRVGLLECSAIAAAALVVADWRLNPDPALTEAIREAVAGATAADVDHHLVLLAEVELDSLWLARRYDEARSATDRRAAESRTREREAAALLWADGAQQLVVETPRREQQVRVDRALREAIVGGEPSSVAVVDVDDLRRINHEHGYVAGDLVLQELGELLERICRRNDSVARLGGDDFVVVLRSASPGDARNVFERVRQQVASRSWRGLGVDERVTVSIGTVVVSGDPTADPAAVLGKARAGAHEAFLASRTR